MRLAPITLLTLLALPAAAFAQPGPVRDPFGTPPNTASAQPANQPLPSTTQPSTIQTSPALPAIDGPLKLVSLTILLVEAPASKLPDDLAPDELLPLVDKLARDNELTGHTRLALSTVDGQPGFVQNGEQVNVVTSIVDPRVGGRVSPRNVSRQAIGTIVRCTPRVVEGGVVASLEIEDSRLVPVAKPMGAPEEPVVELPPTVQTTVARSVITIPTGRTVLVGGQRTTTPDGKSRQSLILVTAKVVE
jgi:hypothetical protein